MDTTNMTPGTAAPVQTPAATPAPAAPVISDDPSAATNAASSIASATGPQQPPPVPTQDQNIDAGVKRSKLATVAQDLAGGQTTDYVQGPNGPVAVKRNLKPGEMARNILASAFSLLGAGASGDLAAREGRTYQQPEDQTIGGMEKARVAGRQQEAQNEFKDKQVADAATLQAHKAAQEQQESIARVQEYADNHRKFLQAYDTGDLDNRIRGFEFMQKQHDQAVTDQTNWAKYMAEPGAAVMKDSAGSPLTFYDIGRPGDSNYQSAGQQLQAYVVKHPETMHGSVSGDVSNKYGVVSAVNPWTGALQLIDYPANRNEIGMVNVGQAIGPDGKLKFDKNGDPVANTDPAKGPVIYSPTTKKPTVLTQKVSAAQVGDIVSKQISEDNVKSEMRDRDAQARLRDAQVKAIPELNDALNVFNEQGAGKLTAKQRTALSTLYGREMVTSNTHLNQQTIALETANKTGASDADIAIAKKNYEDAKNDYDDIKGKYDELTGLTPGVKLANGIIRSGKFAGPNWPNVNSQIVASGLPELEQEAAKAKIWNAMSPAQQSAATAASQSSATPTTTPSKPNAQVGPGGHQIGDVVLLKDGVTKRKITGFTPDGKLQTEAVQ